MLLLVYGLYCVGTQSAHLPGAGRSFSHGLLSLNGSAAVAMGGAWVGLAIALHARYFWGRIEPWWRYAPLGTWFGITLVAVGWGYALIDSVIQFR